jgi:SAM-dependent methyltransferase
VILQGKTAEMRPGVVPALKPHLSAGVQAQLRCPVCKAQVNMTSEQVLCLNPQCAVSFPVIDGVPVLINEKTSIFSIDDFTGHRNTTFQLQLSRSEAFLRRLLDLLPDINVSIGTKRNYAMFRDLVLSGAPAPKILVLGGSIQGQGMEPMGAESLELVATDVSFGPLTTLVCDAHDIPFDDGTFDGVIAQAVLEHVVDPYRTVEEIHRVLKHGGFVYAETPFIQQVHMGRYDFTRFTHSGHRRLFRRFREIAGGSICGPGVALAWSYQYFLLSFAKSRMLRGVIRGFARMTSFYLKYADYYLIDKSPALDAASGFFFMGRKEGTTLTDRELIGYYKGAVSN